MALYEMPVADKLRFDTVKNGDFTEINHGFNFVGLGFNYSF